MIYPFCDLKALCFYLAFVWFSRVYIVMERGRNLAEKFRKEIIINRLCDSIEFFFCFFFCLFVYL